MEQLAESYLAGLRGDHARFSRVLSMLSRDARRLENEPEKVLPLYREAVDYIVDFQNVHHHPREEIMFARVAENALELKPTATRLTREHNTMDRIGRELLGLLDRITTDAGGRRARRQLAKKLEKFAREMRAHINQEEELLYSQVWTELTESDWQELVATEIPNDPLGRSAGERYPLLTRYVITGDAESVVSLPDHPIERLLRPCKRRGGESMR